MFKIICVTNRKLCREPFLTRVERLAAAGPDAVILREKDLDLGEYQKLAAAVQEICRRCGVTCILHNFAAAAAALDCGALHLPLSRLRELAAPDRAGSREAADRLAGGLQQAAAEDAPARFNMLGASCHSAEEAAEAERLGASYITAGHVFDTACKAGAPGRGTDFLRKVCESVDVPVYAIGGISAANVAQAAEAGAAGACIMSASMTCADPASLIAGLREAAAAGARPGRRAAREKEVSE